MITILNKQKIVETVGLAALIVLCMNGIVQLQQPKLQTLTKSSLTPQDYQQEATKEKVKLDVFKTLPSFGFKNLLADWAMLQFIQYYGNGDARKETGYTLSPDYLDIIVKNDPNFITAYLLISPASSINAGLPERTIAAMNKGLESLSPTIPNAYYVWISKGVDELLFLGDIQSAKNSYQKAAEWAKIANNFFIEQSARNTVTYLSKNPNSRIAQVGAWFFVWTSAPDKKTRQMAHDNIEHLGGRLEIKPNGQVFAHPPKE